MARSTPRQYAPRPIRALWPSPSGIATRRMAAKADSDYGVPADPPWREVDWPSLTHTAEIDGRAVNYVDIGEGDDTIVFIHGLGGSWQNWLEALPSAAAHGHRAIALDLPGFGRSEMPTGDVSITTFAQTVDALCEQLGTGPVHLVGNSMGGFTAAEVGIRHPARATSMVLVDAAGLTTYDLGKNPIAKRFATVALGGNSAATAKNKAGQPRAHDLLKRPAGVHAAMAIVARHPTRLARDLLYEQMLAIGAPGFLPALNSMFGYDYHDELPQIGCPTLIMQGEKDALVPVGDAYEYARMIPGSELLFFADTGHVPMLERPAAFNSALESFLERHPASHPPAEFVAE